MKIYTVVQATVILGISEGTVKKYIYSGDLHAKQIGMKLMIEEDDLTDFWIKHKERILSRRKREINKRSNK